MEVNGIVIGNILALCAMISDGISGISKKRRQILAVQIVSQFFYGASSIVLKGYSSTVQNGVGVLRNVAAIKDVKNRILEWALILAGVVLGIVFNNLGLLGWLPIVANFQYSVSVFRFRENEKALKLSFIISMLMFAVFNGVIMNYVGVASCTIISVITAVSIYRAAKRKDPEALKETASDPEE